jgi:hypothetical protein
MSVCVTIKIPVCNSAAIIHLDVLHLFYNGSSLHTVLQTCCILSIALPAPFFLGECGFFDIVSSGVNSNFQLARLCYHTITQSQTFLPGFYNICAKVCYVFSNFLTKLTYAQVIGFVPGIHEPSPTYDNDTFAFIGDILYVCCQYILQCFA